MADSEKNVELNLNIKVTSELTDETEAATASEKTEAIKLLLEQLAKVSPALGEVAEAAMSGPLAPAVLVGMGLEHEHEELKQHDEELDKVAEANARPAGEGAAGLSKVFDEASQNLGKYQAALKEAGNDSDPIKTQLERIKQLTVAQLELEKVVSGSTTGSTAIFDEKIAAVSGSASLMLEQSIREKVATEFTARANNAITGAAKAQGKFDDDQKQKQNLQNSLGKGKYRENDIDFLADQKRIDDATAAVENAKRRKRDGMEGARESAGHTPENGEQLAADFDEEIAEAQRDLDSANANRALKERRLNQLNANETSRTAILTEAEYAKALAQNQSIINKSRLIQLPGEIGQAMAVETLQQQMREATTVFGAQGGQLQKSIEQLVTQTNITNEKITSLIEKILSTDVAIQQRISKLEAQLQASRNNFQH